EQHAKVLTSELELADAFEEVAKNVDPDFAALWMRDELKRVIYYNKMTFAQSGITPSQITELLKLLEDKKITTKAAQRIIENMPNNPSRPGQIAEELGLIGVIEDEGIIKAVKQAIDENPQAVEDYKEGKKESLNFLVGQVMRLTRGKAEPAKTVEMLKEYI
ncbi:MAG: Asp-tRNA(Asn)/Glu-tRNA(Gln) amidotransferase GatCAB subunit B, partial [Methanobacteriaceae archaeon]|nr:Asp-tRNA(Asn)/Glu-tRNA(Gln) amidotransferase GatCAB subunit B [Methanobacteriaceae archaeon]